jgi:hypothetical protein
MQIIMRFFNDSEQLLKAEEEGSQKTINSDLATCEYKKLTRSQNRFTNTPSAPHGLTCEKSKADPWQIKKPNPKK